MSQNEVVTSSFLLLTNFDTMGDQLCLSENNIYGFEIVDKPYVETNAKDAIYRYEVFYLSEIGEKVLYDSNEVYVTPSSIAEWKTFAEQMNHYFDGGILLLKACGLRFEYSTDIERQLYLEGLTWLIVDGYISDLDAFLEEQEGFIG